jgi:DNA-directed RNA polymerase specialized sigma24 family protein
MELQGEILNYAIASADIRAKSMVRRIGALAPDLDDIRQDLLVSVIGARYETGRSSPRTFISRVMDKAGCKIIRRRMNEWRLVPIQAN